MEIKITSCSSFDILKPISIFLSQNPSIGKIKEDRDISTKKIQTGGEKEKEEEKENITGTPIYHFSKFMDTLLSRKQTEDQTNKQVYNSLFPNTTKPTTTTKINTTPITTKSIVNNIDERENSLEREKIPSPSPSPSPSSSPSPSPSTSPSPSPSPSTSPSTSTSPTKKIHTIINPPIIKSIFIEIHTKKLDKLKAIKGTKLYYLAQRNGKCTSFI
jgi:hypothetical protein